MTILIILGLQNLQVSALCMPMCKSLAKNNFGPDNQMIILLFKICNKANVADPSLVLASAIRARFGVVNGELITMSDQSAFK
jgi:hypothetical protein